MRKKCKVGAMLRSCACEFVCYAQIIYNCMHPSTSTTNVILNLICNLLKISLNGIWATGLESGFQLGSNQSFNS